MNTPRRIQLSRKKGWLMPPNTIRVCRPTYFGNPFKVGRDGAAEECVELFRMAILSGSLRRLPYKPGHSFGWMTALRGKNLACWCPEGSPCHADVLLEIANA